MPSPVNESHARILGRAIAGGVKGGAAGAAASLATGAAIVVTTPAWLPFIGGSAVVAMGTLAAWSAAGSIVGAIASAGRAYFKQTREERAFEAAFPPTSERNSHEQ